MSLRKLEWWDRYKDSDESTDIRGWKLLDRTGHCMGEISDLIFEEDRCRVLYAHPDEGARGGTAIPPGLETQPYGRIYLRMADGRYLPMVWRSEVER